MALYRVVGAERDPGYVVADDLVDAVGKWASAVAAEEGISVTEVDEPDAVERICGDEDLIIEEGWKA